MRFPIFLTITGFREKSGRFLCCPKLPSANIRESILYDIAARRPAYPTDMAGLMLYLASDDASYTTGQVICVDGGWTAGFSGDY